MDLTKILSISGKPDLYMQIAQSKNGMIVESLEDKKRLNAFATMKISSLQDIAIYTESEDLPLSDVFKKIFEKENEGQTISHKSSANELKSYFEEVLPDYDKDRVYVSDIKRVIKWYNILQKHELIDLQEDVSEDNNESDKKESVSKNTETPENKEEKETKE